MTLPAETRPVYGPITRTIDLDDARAVCTCTAGSTTWEAAMATATSQLPHSSLGRRRDVARMVLQSVMGCATGEWCPDALGLAMGDERLPQTRARSLFATLYCLRTPLLRQALCDMYIPRLETDGSPLGDVTVAEWLQWLTTNLSACAEGSLRRTRETQTTMLRKFGYVVGSPGSRPVPQRPDPCMFYAALVGDYAANRWSTRGQDYVLGSSGPRSVTLVTRDYAVHCIKWAEQHGLLRLVCVGPDVDVTVTPDDPVGAAAEVVLSAS